MMKIALKPWKKWMAMISSKHCRKMKNMYRFFFSKKWQFLEKKLFAPKKWAIYTMHFLPKNTFLRRISSSAGVSPPFTRRILWLGFCNHPLALSTPLTHQPPWLCRWRGPPPRHECPLTHLQSLQFVILLTYSSFRRFLCIFWYLVLSAAFASLKYFFGNKILFWHQPLVKGSVSCKKMFLRHFPNRGGGREGPYPNIFRIFSRRAFLVYKRSYIFKNANNLNFKLFLVVSLFKCVGRQ